MKYWAIRFRFMRGNTWIKASRLISKDAGTPVEAITAEATEACTQRGEVLREVVEVNSRR